MLVLLFDLLVSVIYIIYYVISQSPSVYSGFRRKALEHALQNINSTLSSNQEPLYIYGDFNFRLDFSAVLEVSLPIG